MFNKIIVLFFLLTIACTVPKEKTNQFHVFQDGKWNKNEKIIFKLPNIKEGDTPLFYIGHSAAYPYQNLWLFVEYKKQDTIMARDTIEIQIAKPDGDWLGKGHAGLYQLSTRIRIPKNKDTLEFSLQIEHGMRENSLRGITQIGIVFSEIKQ